MDDIWEANIGTAVLYTWYNYLKEDALIYLGITDCYEIKTVYPNGRTEGNCDTRHCKSRVRRHSKEQNVSEDKSSHVKQDNCHKTTKPDHSNHRSLKRKKESVKISESLDNRAVFDSSCIFAATSFLDYLSEHNEDQLMKHFQKSSHSCQICFSEKQGSDCYQFRCRHVFCKECIQGFFTTLIAEGSVDSLKCLAVDCKITPTPHEIKLTVQKDIFERYDRLLLQRALESMNDVVYCPRPQCNNPALREQNEKLATCSVCRYSFCSFCKMGFHGVEPCKFKSGMIFGYFI